ncbi:MAG: GntR family transcriptional regulator [Rhodobacter sp.]|nr:GntR family transcriptional regulator [Paracoccaceae bacterium]MCC0075215.1 GntR family transcriptional regulator [Rhodobacter sp.]
MTLAERAVEMLRDAILSGRLPGPHALTERLVVETLGMSRTPVRAALQTLANEGLLSYEPHRGYSVRQITAESVTGAYQVRGVLEGLACHQLAEAGLSKATIETLGACVRLGQELLADGGASFRHDEWREMNTNFHQTIARAAGNETLLETLSHVSRLPLTSFNTIALIGATPDFKLLEAAQADHEQIFIALVSGQAERAETRMKEHIAVAGALIAKGMAEGEQHRSRPVAGRARR